MNGSKNSNHDLKKNKTQPKKQSKSRIVIKALKVTFFIFLIIAFTVAGAAFGLVTSILKSTDPIDETQISPEGYATIIYDDNDNEIAQLKGAEANRIEVDIDDIPDHLKYAFIAIEDERFYKHSGIDLKSIMRAFVVNIKTRSLSEGGSTLTQQLIKNNVLTSNKNFVRKIQEQYLALNLEKKLSDKYGKKEAKDIILANYLNTINMGSGTFGIGTAAKKYFDKDASQLTIAESAVLSAITPNPGLYNPIENPEKNKKRQVMIIGKLYEQGYITKEQYDQALEEDVYSNIAAISSSINERKTSYNSYYVDAVIEQVLDGLMDLGYNETQASNMLYRGGLSIYTNQDTEIQKILEDTFLTEELYPEADFAVQLDYRLSVEHSDGTQEHFWNPVYPNDPWGTSLFKTKEEAEAYASQFKEEKMQPGDKIIAQNTFLIPQPQAAMVIMDHHTGEVKALVGGRGEKIANRTLNRAYDTNAARHPGSVFKVLAAFGPALDTAGYTPATIVDDVPFTVDKYSPRNWYANSNNKYWYRGLSTIRDGIRDSMNIVAVKTVVDIGIPTAYDYLTSFGFTTLSDEDKYPPIALGGLYKGVTPLELNAAFSAIANNGVYIEPTLYSRVLDQKGDTLFVKEPESHTVIKETTAFLLTDMMEDVVTKGTGWRAKFDNVKMPIAGKTGTSSDSKDLTFSAYTPYYSASIWTGYDLPTPLRHQSYHLTLWKTAMEKIHETKGLEYKSFETPSGIVQRDICVESGKLATELCEKDPRGSRVITEYFVSGTEPTEPCDVHFEEKICTESGLFATEYCPEDTVEMKVFIKRPEDMALDYDKLDQATLNKIEDYQYMLPPSMEGEYCQIHGPHTDDDDDDFNPLDILFGHDSIPSYDNNKDNDSIEKENEDTQGRKKKKEKKDDFR